MSICQKGLYSHIVETFLILYIILITDTFSPYEITLIAR